MFTQGFKRNSHVIAPFVGILLAKDDDGAHCDSKPNNKDDDVDDLFYGQCLKRQVYNPQVPYPAWDYNWDGRMTADTTLEALSNKEHQKKINKGTTRHVIFIRHGQYDETHEEDDKRVLTALGRIQAELTGRRLAIMRKGFGETFGACNITAICSSDMTRAKETATIIAKFLPGVPLKDPDIMLNEVLPAPIIPVRPEIDATQEIDEHSDTVEAAFHKYIYRADNNTGEKNEHEFDVIVCHGNLIRYMTCRALQIPPEAWLRMSIFNCSLTYIMIKPNGYCTCRMLGDIGHLGYEHSTFSRGHGFVWS